MMNIKCSNHVFLLISLVICICLYWPSLNGEPIWDDLGLWFYDPAMNPQYTFFDIWKNSSWPFTVSFQKLTFNFWGLNFRNYHVTSLFLHLINSLLLFHLGKNLKWPFYKWIFLLFLFHPTNVITISWMIQVKTLLCFAFAMGSFITFNHALDHKKWYPLAWTLFFLSVCSKSASVALPGVFFIYAFRKQNRKQLLWLIPFFIISIGATYRLITSEVTREALSLELDLKMRIKDKIVLGTEILEEDPLSGLEVASYELLEPRIESIFDKPITALKTMKYYFWKSLVPLNNEPVKTKYVTGMDVTDFLHLLFILSIFVFFRKSNLLIILGASLILMLPLLGIIVAPYMNVTLVSDQHSYLLLPLLLLFWFTLLQKIPFKRSYIFPVLFLPFFLYEVNKTIPYYADDVSFYSASLEADPTNLAMIYNLATTYAMRGEIDKALELGNHIELTQDTYHDVYFKELWRLYNRLARIKARQKKDGTN